MTDNYVDQCVLLDDITIYPLDSINDNGFSVDLKKGESFEITNDLISCFGTSKTISGTIFIPVNNLVENGKAVVR